MNLTLLLNLNDFRLFPSWSRGIAMALIYAVVIFFYSYTYTHLYISTFINALICMNIYIYAVFEINLNSSVESL